MSYEQLKLENQICFPIYALSRLITVEYQPFLEKLELTYPQYLVMMILWEQDNVSVSFIGKKLILNTNTLTPLLKRMETLKLLERVRSKKDERKVFIKLTSKGKELEKEASNIPFELINSINCKEINLDKMKEIKENLNILINHINNK
ncbi:MarR family winged helix-turn-helix transcriptional regulator [Aliarcobacter butzleri]|uniref:MarR family winged helix-turn-helix transcriptional regulator n=1 Tax=Aliarcobacter butzleri TaxID=28197 RepID=UPI003AF6B1CF